MRQTFKDYMQANGRTELDVFVPAGEKWKLGIADGSGIVGSPTNGDRTTIDYEGNLFGAQNIVTFCDRVMQAAGRHIERYPTIARSYVDPEAVIRVGSYDGEVITVDHASLREQLCEWIGCDDGQLDAELRPGTPAWAVR